MSGYTYSVCLTIPAASQEAANRLVCGLGYDLAPLPGKTFLAGYSSDGSDPPTGYFCRIQLTRTEAAVFADLANAAPASGTWEDYGLQSGQIATLIASLTVDIACLKQADATKESRRYVVADDLGAHWRATLSEMSEMRIDAL